MHAESPFAAIESSIPLYSAILAELGTLLLLLLLGANWFDDRRTNGKVESALFVQSRNVVPQEKALPSPRCSWLCCSVRAKSSVRPEACCMLHAAVLWRAVLEHDAEQFKLRSE